MTITTTTSTESIATAETTDVEEQATVTETVAEQAADPAAPLEKDVLFEILKNQRRRDALAYLREHDGTATLSDMAEFIAAKENGITVQELSSSQRKRVYIGLYQCHLPKMDAAGVVDFDKNRGTIVLDPSADQFQPFLVDGVPAAERGPQTLVAAALVGLATAAGAVGAPVFDLVPEAGWAIFSAVALVGYAAYEYLDAERTD